MYNVSQLSEISVYTYDGEIRLSEVFRAIAEKEDNGPAISHKEEKSCEYKLYLSQLTKVLNFGTCIFENLEFLEKQKYIIKIILLY